MKPQFQHEVTTSFVLWLDHYLLEKGTAFKNVTSDLYYLEDDRMPGFHTYSSPYKQWIFDKSVTDSKVPDKVTSSTGDITRNDGLIIDYENGRVLFQYQRDIAASQFGSTVVRGLVRCFPG